MAMGRELCRCPPNRVLAMRQGGCVGASPASQT